MTTIRPSDFSREQLVALRKALRDLWLVCDDLESAFLRFVEEVDDDDDDGDFQNDDPVDTLFSGLELAASRIDAIKKEVQ